MAQIYNNKISISFDVYGCPQRCRHCWLGHPKHSNMDVDEVISTFMRIKEEQNTNRYFGAEIEYLDVCFREPHYGDDYKELYDRVDKINGCSLEIEKNFELISLWRLNHDKDYIDWIKNRGIKRAQLKVFGLEETNNFFYGRENAHKELINGTQILLENGIIPRWQIFFNKKGVNDLQGILDLTKELNIWQKVRELGEEFNIHGSTYDLDGAGYANQECCIEKSDYKKIPSLLLEKSKEHYGDEYTFRTEGELTKLLINEGEYFPLPDNHWLWFFVTSNWDVYPNFMQIAPWWKLGNLKEDSWETILANYKNDEVLGLKAMTQVSVKELARRYGDINGNKLFPFKEDVVTYWIGKYCRELYKTGILDGYMKKHLEKKRK